MAITESCPRKMSAIDKVCMVCGDRALGYNFNAVTCESCKAFFRRNALSNKELTCPFNDKCVITVVTRRFCQRCRLEKCFSIGMRKEYIMSEEDKILKRKKIEQNRVKRRSQQNSGSNDSMAKLKQENDVNGMDWYSSDTVGDGSYTDTSPCSSHSSQSPQVSSYTNPATTSPTGSAFMLVSSPSFAVSPPYSLTPSQTLYNHQMDQPHPDSNVFNFHLKPVEILPLIGSNNSSFTQTEGTMTFPTADSSPSEIIDFMIDHPDDSSRLINQLMPDPKAAMYILTKVMNSQKDAMRLIGHLIGAPGDALKIIGKIMNSPVNALKVFTKFMGNPTDALEIIAKCVNSPVDVLQFIQQLMSTPEDAVEIMNKFMDSPAEAMKMLNDLANSSLVDSTTKSDSEDTGIVPPISSMLQSSNSIENPNESNCTNCNHSSSKSFKNDQIEVVNENFEGKIKFVSLEKLINGNYDKTDNVKANVNPFDAAIHDAISMEYQISLPIHSNFELNETEKAKLKELVIAYEALYIPLDEDISLVTSDQDHYPSNSEKNADDPKLLTLINLTAVAVKRLIKMVKKINSFRNMCQEDQVALLKGGCTEMMILRSIMNYDLDHSTWTIPHSQQTMSSIKSDILKLANNNVYEEYENFIRTFDTKLRKDENIVLIMSAIVLFMPSRTDIVHTDVIKLEQYSYYYLLRRYLESKYAGCEAKSQFLKLIQKINDLQRLKDVIIAVYLDVNPNQVEPLLREIFDLKNI